MEREDLIRRLVLDSICDDYENIDQVILAAVARDGAKCGFDVRRADIVGALRSLVAEGYARAYNLPTSMEAIPAMPDVDVPEEYFSTYFLASAEGLKFHESDLTWWPFDPDGQPEPGCGVQA
jgi:hypothetical protein